jgi:RNA polymerase sigma factor (sigma-70 family)
MTTTHPGIVLRHVRELVAAEGTRGATDGQLLHRFSRGRDESAFAALVRRHGPLVLGVCRRVLRQEQDAEDVFQATFLVLARKAGSLDRRGSLGGWLYQVAYHMALKARRRAAARQKREAQAVRCGEADPLSEVTGRELLAVFDEELQALPEAERQALVLCYLQGKTRDEAARAAGCSASTLKRRLERGKGRLRLRLARRGLALPAALLAAGLAQTAKAAGCGSLAARTVRAGMLLTAGRSAAGVASPQALALACDALASLTANRVNALGAFLVALLFLGAGAGLVASGKSAALPPTPSEAPGEERKAPAATPAAPAAEDRKEAAVGGRVLDGDGKPVKDALVTGYGALEFGSLSVQFQTKGLGEVKTDADGSFSLAASLAAAERIQHVELLAGARGYGRAWKRVSLTSGKEVELRLPPEEAAVGKLIDLQGIPVSRAKMRVVRVVPDEDSFGAPKIPVAGENRMPFGIKAPKIPAKGDDEATKRMRDMMRQQAAFEFRKDSPLKDSPLWPAPVTTDAEGRFRVAGFDKGQEIHLLVEDDRFARQEIIVNAGAKEQQYSLLPPHRVAGRVVAADTGKPVAGAHVGIVSFRDYVGYFADVRTDADGRFSVNAFPGESYRIDIHPKPDEPYLPVTRSDDWPKGAVKQEVDIKLPRGVVVRGKVVEDGSGKPVVSAGVAFVPQSVDNLDLPGGIITGRDHRAWTAADGTFRMVFPPGRGQLVVTGPSADYVYRTVTDGELQSGKPGGRGRYFHAARPAHFRLQDDPKELTIELRRAVTIKGHVVGPDDEPVKDAVVFVPRELLPPPQGDFFFAVFGIPPGTTVSAIPVHDGSFELPNCDPDRTYRIFVLSGQGLGGVEVMAANVARMGMMSFGGAFSLDATSVVNQLIGGKAPHGAVVEVSPKAAGGKPIEVKLLPCQSAEVRFVDAKGKAVKQRVWLELVVKPGAETAMLASPHSLRGEKSPVEPDADGNITIPGLIPGATYRLKVLKGQQGVENETAFEKEFTVEAGKKTKLELAAPEEK